MCREATSPQKPPNSSNLENLLKNLKNIFVSLIKNIVN
jgi:hypothetical protein